MSYNKNMQSKRVLIVDDEPAVTIFLAETLEKIQKLP